MVQAKVHFIEGKHLLVLASHHRTVVVILVTVVYFETRELWILNAYINATHC